MRNTLLLSLFALAACAQAQTLAPDFAASYSVTDLGGVPGLTPAYGGLTLKRGDANTLLIGGAANDFPGVIGNIGLTRTLIGGRMRISGFQGPIARVSSAPYIDGGLAYAPNGTLLFTSTDNSIGQIKPGSVAPDRVSGLDPSLYTGSLLFSPSGALKIISYLGTWSDLAYTLGSDGLYTFGAISNTVQVGFGLEGAVYVPGGSALFSRPAVLINDYDDGRVSAYDTDANGNPIASTERPFLTGIAGVEGATVDPETGDLLLSTYGGFAELGTDNRVVVVRGFAPVPEPSTLIVLGLPAFALLRRRK